MASQRITGRISTTPLLNLSVALSSFLFVLLACFASAAHAQTKAPLLIAAASDLLPLQKDLTDALAKSAGLEVRFSFGASGMLAQQIENGAPFDVYLSADERLVDRLKASRKLVPPSVAGYASGRLGLWSKSGKIKKLEDLLAPGLQHVSIANPTHAPYGIAAREMLRKKGLWDRLEPRIVYGENVQQAFQFAETGNAEACVTAWSLVRGKGGILLQPADYPPIRQSGGIVASSRRWADAQQVLDYLTGSAGKKLLARYGFGVE